MWRLCVSRTGRGGGADPICAGGRREGVEIAGLWMRVASWSNELVGRGQVRHPHVKGGLVRWWIGWFGGTVSEAAMGLVAT